MGVGLGVGVGVGVEGPRRAATAEVAADALARGAVELVGQQVLREIPPEHGGAGGVGWGEVNSGPTIGLQRAVREVAHGVGDQLCRRRELATPHLVRVRLWIRDRARLKVRVRVRVSSQG